jgi:hypothetical protein
MDVSTIAKDYTRLQKQSLNNLFDILSIFQGQVEKTSRYWAYQMGVDDDAQAAFDQYSKVLKQGRDDARDMINRGVTNVEVYFTGIGS